MPLKCQRQLEQGSGLCISWFRIRDDRRLSCLRLRSCFGHANARKCENECQKYSCEEPDADRHWHLLARRRGHVYTIECSIVSEKRIITRVFPNQRSITQSLLVRSRHCYAIKSVPVTICSICALTRNSLRGGSPRRWLKLKTSGRRSPRE